MRQLPTPWRCIGAAAAMHQARVRAELADPGDTAGTFAAGSSDDVLGRILSPKLSGSWASR